MCRANSSLLVIGEVVPRGDVVVQLGVARWEREIRRDDTQLLLTVPPLLAQGVPPFAIAVGVLVDVGALGHDRRVHRPVREVQEDGLTRVGGLVLADHRDRPVGDVVGEEVAVGIAVDLDEVVVLDEPVGVMQVREGVEEAVEAVEPALARPGVLRPGGRAVGVLGEVPLADHERRVPLITEDLCRGDHVVGELHRVAGEPGVGVSDRAETGAVRVHAGEECRTRR